MRKLGALDSVSAQRMRHSGTLSRHADPRRQFPIPSERHREDPGPRPLCLFGRQAIAPKKGRAQGGERRRLRRKRGRRKKNGHALRSVQEPEAEEGKAKKGRRQQSGNIFPFFPP